MQKLAVVVCVAASSCGYSQPSPRDASVTSATFHKFAYTGSAQSFVVPKDVTSILVKAWGAGGGGLNGGAGGFAMATLTVTPGDALSIIVGGAGHANSDGAAFGGGGFGGAGANTGCTYTGGGRSAVRRGGIELITAGGGGGQGGTPTAAQGGAGGGKTGQSGGNGQCGAAGGAGGNQTTGGPGGVANGQPGAMFQGGEGGNNGATCAGGGGGGGAYGGGGGGGPPTASNCDGAGGGGGASAVPTDGTTIAGAGTRAGASSDPDYFQGTANANEPGWLIIRIPGGLGATCTDNSECTTAQCANDGSASYCVSPCMTGTCPTGFGCTITGGGTGVCWPDYDEAAGSGCNTASGVAPSTAAFPLIVLALVLRRRRSPR